MSFVDPFSFKPSDTEGQPQEFQLSEAFPEEVSAPMTARGQIPQELVDAFARYITELRPRLIRDQSDLIGSWLLVTKSDLSFVCTKCPLTKVLKAFENARTSGKDVSFLIRLGEEFQRMDDDEISVVSRSGNARRLSATATLQLLDVAGGTAVPYTVTNMMVDTCCDHVVVTNYAPILDGGFVYPVLFGADVGPFASLIPSMSLIARPLVEIAGQGFCRVPRIVIPFDLFFAYTLFKHLATENPNAVFKSRDQATSVFLDEAVAMDHSVYGQLVKWLAGDFAVPQDPQLLRFLRSKGIAPMPDSRFNGILGLSFLLQAEFRFSAGEENLRFIFPDSLR